MNIILKLGAGALTAGMTIMAAGCAQSGASSHIADASTSGPYVSSPPAGAQNAEDKAPRVKVEEAKNLIAGGKAVIVDGRGAETLNMAYGIWHMITYIQCVAHLYDTT